MGKQKTKRNQLCLLYSGFSFGELCNWFIELLQKAFLVGWLVSQSVGQLDGSTCSLRGIANSALSKLPGVLELRHL